jgi:hypothetical protein
MNSREKRVKQRYERNGWTILRGGWPDFLAIRDSADGQVEHMGIEVKSHNNRLSACQEKMHEALQKIGVKVSIDYSIRSERKADETVSGLLTVNEAATHLQTSPQLILDLVRREGLKTVLRGAVSCVSQIELDGFLMERYHAAQMRKADRHAARRRKTRASVSRN